MPRIAVVTPLFPIYEESYRGKAIYNTILRLQDLAEVEVFCPLAVYPPHLRPRFQYYRSDLTYWPKGIDKAHYFEYPVLPVVTRPLNGYACARFLLPLVRQYAPDLILNYWLYPEGFASVQVGRELGKPVIVGSRGSDLRCVGDPFTRWLVQRTVQHAHYVLTVSGDLRERAINFGADPARTRSIPNGVNHEVFFPNPNGNLRAQERFPENAKVILFVGYLAARKGVMELIHAFRSLAAEDPTVRLVCVGEGNLRGFIEDYTQEWGLRDRVRLCGKCQYDEVADWMNAADVLCLPSRSEGCPNVMLEAFGCGCPVVATEVGGIPEHLNDRNGIMVPVNDSERLTGALREALARRWDRGAIARHAVRTWGQVAAETYDVCLSVLDSVAPRRVRVARAG